MSAREGRSAVGRMGYSENLRVYEDESLASDCPARSDDMQCTLSDGHDGFHFGFGVFGGTDDWFSWSDEEG